jgi:hypothetical protein
MSHHQSPPVDNRLLADALMRLIEHQIRTEKKMDELMNEVKMLHAHAHDRLAERDAARIAVDAVTKERDELKMALDAATLSLASATALPPGAMSSEQVAIATAEVKATNDLLATP